MGELAVPVHTSRLSARSVLEMFQYSQGIQPILFMDDESRLARIEGIPEEAREWLADLFIVLRRRFTKEGCGPQVVQAELDRFIELLFRDSEAYRLALQLYAGRYEVITCKDAAEILRQVIAEHMPKDQQPEK